MPELQRRITAAVAMSGEDEAFRDSVFEILLSSHDLVENARLLAQKAGYHTVVDNSCDDWDYADAAKYLLQRFDELRKAHERVCLISVGEVTVTMNRTPGAGGRNQQFVLECALNLEKFPGQLLTVLSAGSDGIDGNTRSAGSIADPTTVARARSFGFNPEESLAEFNACPLFTALGDSVVTGPTGHNLRDSATAGSRAGLGLLVLLFNFDGHADFRSRPSEARIHPGERGSRPPFQEAEAALLPLQPVSTTEVIACSRSNLRKCTGLSLIDRSSELGLVRASQD